MAISDVVVGNLTTLYLTVIAVIKLCGLASGRSFAGGYVLMISTVVVIFILIGTLTWDVSRKATCLVLTVPDKNDGNNNIKHEMCRGGICWHGVAVKSPVSEVRFRLPQHVVEM